MTIHSSDPRDPKRDILRKTDTSSVPVTMMMIAAALLVALGIGWYVMSDSRNTASILPATTTGQSTESPRPVPMPVNPAPTTPAPTEAPKAQ